VFPQVKFSIQIPNARGDTDEQMIRTKQSASPSGTDPNFLQELVLECQLPKQSIFCPTLQIQAIDERLNGLWHPVLGTGRIPLEKMLPWDKKKFVPPAVDRVINTTKFQQHIKQNKNAPHAMLLFFPAHQVAEKVPAYRYIRFRPLKARSKNGDGEKEDARVVKLSGLQFYRNGEPQFYQGDRLKVEPEVKQIAKQAASLFGRVKAASKPAKDKNAPDGFLVVAEEDNAAAEVAALSDKWVQCDCWKPEKLNVMGPTKKAGIFQKTMLSVKCADVNGDSTLTRGWDYPCFDETVEAEKIEAEIKKLRPKKTEKKQGGSTLDCERPTSPVEREEREERRRGPDLGAAITIDFGKPVELDSYTFYTAPAPEISSTMTSLLTVSASPLDFVRQQSRRMSSQLGFGEVEDLTPTPPQSSRPPSSPPPAPPAASSPVKLENVDTRLLRLEVAAAASSPVSSNTVASSLSRDGPAADYTLQTHKPGKEAATEGGCECDPIQWLVEGSLDGKSVWKVLHDQSLKDALTPMRRSANIRDRQKFQPKTKTKTKTQDTTDSAGLLPECGWGCGKGRKGKGGQPEHKRHPADKKQDDVGTDMLCAAKGLAGGSMEKYLVDRESTDEFESVLNPQIFNHYELLRGSNAKRLQSTGVCVFYSAHVT
jgi:hypothetical protein